MIESGYVREADQGYREDAVIWWYVARRDDGTVFARGGRVRTSRIARHNLRDAHELAPVEEQLAARMRRTRLRLTRTGLAEIPR